MKIPYGKQSIDAQDIERVIEVLKSDWISQGPTIKEFEDAIAAYCDAKYAVAVSNGTAALHLACLVAGLSKGDEAVTTPITFLSTANSVLFTGAKPVFADINYKTVNIEAAAIEKKINKKTKAVLPVHFAGLPADMKEIQKIAKKNRLVMIEDGCHALGSEYGGSKTGSCQYSDMTVFSFHPVKHITTGEGGCITTHNKKYYEKLLALRNHGVYRSDALKQKIGGWFTEMRDLGFNYRITDIQCALGVGQLKKIESFVKRRHEIALRYNQAFAELGDRVQLPQAEFKDRKHSWHLYLFRLNLKKSWLTRRQLFDALAERGINSQVHYIPVYRQPYYRQVLKGSVQCPNAERYYEEVVSLPMYPALSDDEINYVIETVKEILLSPSPSLRERDRVRVEV